MKIDEQKRKAIEEYEAKIETLILSQRTEIYTDWDKWKEILNKRLYHPGRYEYIPQELEPTLALGDLDNVNLNFKPFESLRFEFSKSESSYKGFPNFIRSNPIINNDLFLTHLAKLFGFELKKDGYKRYFISKSGNLIRVEVNVMSIEFEWEEIHNTTSAYEEIWVLMGGTAEIFMQLENPEDKTYPISINLEAPYLKDKEYGKKTPTKPEDKREPVDYFNVQDFLVPPTQLNIDDIGGNKKVKDELKDLILFLKNRAYFNERGAILPNGYLFSGPPGVGKTMAASIIGSNLGIPFYTFTPADLQTVYAGNTVKIIQKIFADIPRPAIIFFDEIDGITPRVSQSSNILDIRNQLQIEISKALGHDDGLLVIGATNNIQGINPAMLRNGRLGRIIYFDLPDKEARCEIIRIYLNKILEKSLVQIFDDTCIIEEEIEYYSTLTKGFSGADIDELFKRILFKSTVRSLSEPGFLVDVEFIINIIDEISFEKDITNPQNNENNNTISMEG